MVNVFGDSIAGGPGNLQMMKKVVVTESKVKDYGDEIQQSYELGFTPYRLHKNTDDTFVTPHPPPPPIRYYDGRVDDGNGDGGSGVALQGDRGPSGARGLKGDSGDKGAVGSRGPTGKRGVEGPEGPPGKIGKMGPVGSKGKIGARGEKVDKGDTGDVGPRSVQGAKGLRGVAGIQGPLGVQGPVDATGEQGERGRKGHYGIDGLVGDKGDRSSIAELPGGVETLRNLYAYNEPTCRFDAKFVNGQGHERANVQKATGHGHFLEMKNWAYYCPYDLADNKVNAIYIFYKIRKYDSTVQSTITSSPVEWAIIIVVYASSRMKRQ